MAQNTWIEQFPEFEGAIREGYDESGEIIPLEVLLTARDLVALLGEWCSLQFQPLYFTETLWLTFDADDRRHMTIKIGRNLGLMFLWNVSTDLVYQDEIRFRDIHHLCDDPDVIKEALLLLSE